MRKTFQHKIQSSILVLLIYLSVYLVTKQFLSGVYLWEWMARHAYVGTWLGAIGFIFCNQEKIAYSIAIGNVIGIGIGQFAGDWIRYQRMLKITADMEAETRYHLQHHPGVELWLLAMLVCVTGMILFQAIQGKKKTKR